MTSETMAVPNDPAAEPGEERAGGGPDRFLTFKRVVMVLAAVNLGLLASATYMHTMTAPAAVQPESVVEEERSAEETAQNEPAATSAPSGGQVSARVSSVGGRPAVGLYRRRGNISDIFCQPWPDETEAEWRARVADSCEV